MIFLKRFFPFLVFLIFLSASVFIGINGCQPSPKTEQMPAQDLPKTLKPVEVAVAKQDKIRSDLNLSGTVMANAKVAIFSKVAGQIVELPVEVGQRVNRGDLLAVIEHEELILNQRQAEANYRSAQANYKQAQKLAQVQVEGQVEG